MIYNTPIEQLITKRKSTRAYSDTLPEDTLISQIKEYLDQQSTGDFQFQLVSTTAQNKKLGTYGMIKNARLFIVSTMNKGFFDYPKFGYQFEKIILYATSLGLATCWLGGTFSRKQFSSAVSLKENHFIPVISPLGYSLKNQGLVRNIIRKQIKADTRKPWKSLFFDTDLDTPLEKNSLDSNYASALEMLRLGPSASNKQPWIVIKDNNDYNFYLKRDEGYGKGIKYDMQKNDLGIAMCHFELTLQERSMNGHWQNKEKKHPALEYISTWQQNK